ncbi:MAG: CYTH domain protein [bacterium ADurb.Bin400]|nr:MAG: CYTH domain protein [bacterium ADurb.Bin400]
MIKTEVEHRGLLTRDQFDQLTRFFGQRGQVLDRKKRFSIIYLNANSSVREVKDDPIDLRVRITNGQAELAMKHGRWGGKDARREFSFKIESDKFSEMVEFLKALGYHKVVLMANTKYDYRYKGIEFSLVEVPEWGYYYEAEILTRESGQAQADKQLEDVISELGLTIIDQDNYYSLLDELNSREGYRLDLEQTDFNQIQQRFSDYFHS